MEIRCRVHEACKIHLLIVVKDRDVLLLRPLIGGHPRDLWWQGIVILRDYHLDRLVKGVMPFSTLPVVMLPCGVLPGMTLV